MSLQQQIVRFWAARDARERRLLGAGATVLAGALLYLVLVAPAADGVQRLQRLLPQTRTRAAELDALVAEARSLRSLPQAATLAPADARSALDKSLDLAGLKASKGDPLGNGDLRLRFAAVPYGKWSAWLAQAEHTLGVHAVAVRVQASGGTPPVPGNADIELTLHLPRAG
jgi:general secretion pathway protein M